jgi:protein-S-isoprenylcysteine O-methyltransferase Ste14
MFVLMRAITYAALFIGLVLVFVPARLLTEAGIVQPEAIGLSQVAGMLIAATGAVLALACVVVFALVGRGTPAPFDPPRRLVVRGPYRFMRNPMYAGAALTLSGAALYYRSLELLGYAGLFVFVAHLFVVLYEEPKLRRTFGAEYEAYCRMAPRWSPVRPGMRLVLRRDSREK